MDIKQRLAAIDALIHAATHEIDGNEQTILRLLNDGARLADRNVELRGAIDTMLETRMQTWRAQLRRDGAG